MEALSYAAEREDCAAAHAFEVFRLSAGTVCVVDDPRVEGARVVPELLPDRGVRRIDPLKRKAGNVRCENDT